VDERKSGFERAEVSSFKRGESCLQEGIVEMSFDEGLGIFLWVTVIIGSIAVIMLHRRGKVSLAMTAGAILAGIGMAADVPLPTVAPSLANMPIKASWISLLGWLLITVSLLRVLREKRKSS
jgi:hypothetical protein